MIFQLVYSITQRYANPNLKTLTPITPTLPRMYSFLVAYMFHYVSPMIKPICFSSSLQKKLLIVVYKKYFMTNSSNCLFYQQFFVVGKNQHSFFVSPVKLPAQLYRNFDIFLLISITSTNSKFET